MASRALWFSSLPVITSTPTPTPTRSTTLILARHSHVRRLHHGRSVQGTVCCLSDGRCSEVAAPPRRSANYQPTLWDDSFIQTLASDCMDVGHTAKLEELKSLVRGWIISDGAAGAAAKLELLDVVRRLGVSYHFEQEIELVLHAMSAKLDHVLQEMDGDLPHTALLFRLLREHGLPVPQDVFNIFKDENGSFKRSLKDDVEGILSLYEASFLAFQGEETLAEARAFAIDGLKEFLLIRRGERELIIIKTIRERVEYALEMPLHWRMPRLYTRWFIGVYERDTKASPVLLELAKLDFNVVQVAHKRDCREASRWWRDLGLHKLHFARDRLMECFFWTMGIIFEPQFWLCRRGLTRINQLITTIDDVYDVYGSIDELESFTKVVERWDVNSLEELPDYMKVCFQALWDTTNDSADQCFRRNGFNCLSYLKKSWIDLCKAYLVEARWYHNKHMPTLGEYLENAWISISGPVILTHAYFMLSENVTREDLDIIGDYGDLFRWSSTILRLNDDLATSVAELERGDVPKSVQCHMHESNVPEVMAREDIKALISDAWMQINKGFLVDKHFPVPFVKAAVNLARISHLIYQYGDGFGVPDKETKDFVNILLIEPIQ